MENLSERLNLTAYSYSRLLFILFPEASIDKIIEKTNELSIPSINLSFELGRALLDLSIKDRIYYLRDKLQEIIFSKEGDTFFLYHIEILFEPSLENHPVTLLENLSRMKTLLVQWPGEYDGKNLIYGKDGHKEYVKHKYSSEMVLLIT